jgi:membrane fusion protein (multidrug efflux system)
MAQTADVEAAPKSPAPNQPPSETHSAAAPPPPRAQSFFEQRPHAKTFLIIAFLVLVVGGVALWFYFSTYESTDDAQVDGHVMPISARITGYVSKVNVNDNQQVKAGDVLIEIDPRDYQVAVDQARASLEDAESSARALNINVPITSVNTTSQTSTAQAGVENARAGISGSQQQADAAKAELAEAQANNVKAQNDLVRYKQLVDKQEISQQQFDQVVADAKAKEASVAAAQATVAAADEAVTQARSKLVQADADLQNAQTGPRQVLSSRARALAAEATVQEKQAALDQAELNLSYTKIVAPMNGIVTKSVEVGMNVQPGQQLLTVIPLDDVWVTANFKETQLRKMRPGQEVKITADANGREYRGHVDSIAGSSGARLSLLPPENATGNYVKVVQRVPVKIVLDPGENQDHYLRIGMSVEPKVYLDRSR